MNSDYQSKLEAAMDELAKTDIWKSSYDPLVYRILRRFGINMKPPYYNSFFGNALSQGISFVVIFGALKYVIDWYRDRLEYYSFLTVFVSALFVAILMAAYYAYKKKKHNLTDWENL